MFVQKVKEEDLPDLAVLYEQLSGNPSRLEKMKELFTLLNQNSHYSLLGAYTENGKLVGTVMGLMGYDLAMECQPILFMENMVVDKSFRKQGVGKALLSQIEKIAKENNCLFIQYCSSGFRKGAHRFYESMGYAPDLVKGYRKYMGEIRVHEIH